MGEIMLKRVLMIAFHFPPLHGSSGIQRTLKFAKYLPEHGWEPLVLTAHPRAYAHTGADQLGELPHDTVVRRAFACDAARQLAVFGRYPGWLAQPDRWISWAVGAIPAGLLMIRRYRPQLIWSTYPIATAHVIGHALHRLSGLPWIADFRDPMLDEYYPPDPLTRRVRRRVETRTLQHCAAAVVTTPGVLRRYRGQYPAAKCTLIENGYDEADFAQLPAQRAPAQRFTLLHSGLIYPSERDPSAFLQAAGELARDGLLRATRFRTVLRAPGHEEWLKARIAHYGAADIVEVAPHLGYRDALADMAHADGLLVLQAANCNEQIPAKLYEYLRLRRPVLGLTDAAGDTAATLHAAGIDTIAPLDSVNDIKRALLRFIDDAQAGLAPLPSESFVATCSRSMRTAQLAQLMEEICYASEQSREEPSLRTPWRPG
ncbi:glycosyltransferase [Massilia sp. SM-13]|uniref:glycosyltransferase n=1 Tax=Pseudoduganella rhizocola TaxID=3382643 RepID=UPI0038B4B7C6